MKILKRKYLSTYQQNQNWILTLWHFGSAILGSWKLKPFSCYGKAWLWIWYLVFTHCSRPKSQTFPNLKHVFSRKARWRPACLQLHVILLSDLWNIGSKIFLNFDWNNDKRQNYLSSIHSCFLTYSFLILILGFKFQIQLHHEVFTPQIQNKIWLEISVTRSYFRLWFNVFVFFS